MYKKFAFTLAEVLITLGIIGVVAAMTLPTLLSNYRKNVAVTQLKKAYSEISQAMQLAESEHGFMEDWHFENIEDSEYSAKKLETRINRGIYFAEEYILKHLNVIRKCDYNSDSCWQNPKTMSGADTTFQLASHSPYTFITKSGYSAYVWLANVGYHGGIAIDIDGPQKGSSVVGKDVFIMYFYLRDDEINNYKKGLGMYGAFENDITANKLKTDTTKGCNNTSTNAWAGAYCGLLIQRNGWEIPKDYPVKF